MPLPLQLDSELVSPHEHNELALLEHASTSSRQNPIASWSILDLTVSQYGLYVNKTVRPTEWDLIHAYLVNANSPIPEIYRWVDSKWDGSALLNSHGPTPRKLSALKLEDIPVDSSSIITRYVRNEPWTKPDTKRKGSTDPLPSITMLSAYIVALYSPESLLRCYMTLDHSLGAPWADKHGHKFMTPFNLARMGLVKPLQKAIYRSPKYLSAWTLKPLSEILDLATNFFRLLNDGPYGPYHATALIFGTAVANRLSSVSEHCAVLQFLPPPPQPSAPIPSSSKRTLDPVSDDSDYAIQHSSRNRRKRRRV